MLFDFHTHLDFYEDFDIEKVCSCIIKNKIKTFSASVNIESYKRNLNIKAEFIRIAERKGFSFEEADDLVNVSFGVHPSYLKYLPKKENDAVNLLRPFYEESEIISEIGLDFFWEKESSPELQLMHLLIALDSANEGKKICVLHTKGAEKEIISVLKDFPNVRPVIHWYDGPIDIYKKFIERGIYVTFGCELKYSDTIKDFLTITPESLILPETDNPSGEIWLGGADNSPALIKRIYKDIGEGIGKSIQETESLLELNLKSLLR
ncbi:MAG: TatD family hydrolase [Treponema sp.]|nr:TatD family hydrolase [Treponema sp.]